ncbi:hypothetical protein MCHIJ_10680 [Mycolicibacterium chitae]|uniref:Putative secreted protein n=1 Tax=Mycolicibacterium chitae TaxID=1792 RepID=A0A3S4VFN0_MYCCI|nr:hypothetical protein [Mycolicibacterium chitae]MCV7107571.1 hypothetical protein [Mycolicibacterium chitae]BBZ01631.1 hypothetical protein MCHIJ_10680 [Mycolicibacterium chitae]VEG50467.1 putative secreted protein [Mycolicibacterium chitae]
MIARISAALGSATLAASLAGMSAAPASADDEVAVNGVYTAVSDGQWSATNERFELRPSLISTWTISSHCQNYLDCTGRVESDHGWQADLTYRGGDWWVEHTVPDWLTCPDGTKAPGKQGFRFWADRARPGVLMGWDKTVGPSGACGINRPVVIEMPLTLTPVG